MDILEEECLEFDAVVSIVGGNNKYDYQVITVPKKNVHIKKDGAYIDMLGLDQPFFFPNSEVPCGFKNAIFYLTKDGNSFFVSACFLDEETQKLSKDEQIRTVDRHCIAEFPKAFLYACCSFHGHTLLSNGFIAAAYLDYITLSVIVESSDFYP